MQESVTAAILLGASIFPQHSYSPSPAFLRSKQDFRRYLQDSDAGLALRDDAILDLFDSDHLAGKQLVTVGRFLDKFNDQADRESLRNLIVYYVGHGFFCGQRQEYNVALASLETDYESTTGLKIAELAEVIKQRARVFRRFIFLDCCFAADALAEFQSGAEDIAVKARNAFAEDAPRRQVSVPRRGTALFCAADKDHVARSPKDLQHTMFTDALLDVLINGDRYYPSELNLAEIRDLTWEKLRAKSFEPVRPVLHSPDQSEGDIAASVLLFPNAWHKRVPDTSKPTAGNFNSTTHAAPSETARYQPAPRPLAVGGESIAQKSASVTVAENADNRIAPPISPSAPKLERQHAESAPPRSALYEPTPEPPTLRADTNAQETASVILAEHTADKNRGFAPNLQEPERQDIESIPTSKVAPKFTRRWCYVGLGATFLFLGVPFFLLARNDTSEFDLLLMVMYVAICFLNMLFMTFLGLERFMAAVAAGAASFLLVALPALKMNVNAPEDHFFGLVIVTFIFTDLCCVLSFIILHLCVRAGILKDTSADLKNL